MSDERTPNAPTSPEERDFMEFYHRFRQEFPERVGPAPGGRPDIHPRRRQTDTPPAVPTANLFGWPQVPPATDEQRVMPLAGTNEAKYRAWRATEKGERIYRAIHARAALEAAQGAERIAVKRLAELVRAQFRTPINNTLVAFIAAELAEDPTLAPLIERRHRKAS